MKKILITGKNSYVGNSLINWLTNYPEKYLIETVGLRDESWKKRDFSKFDVVFHVVGIAHVKETKKNSDTYYKVNRDLAFEVAQKAKRDGVKQFIFLSSMSVYGIESGIIYRNTTPLPKSNYGKSKLQAEELINTLNDSAFKVVIIRPPMIYGYGCKGNYSKLSKLSVYMPIFPNIKNQRSMIFIYNLCELVRKIIDTSEKGTFFPQNKEYVCTKEMVDLISKANNKKIRFINIFNPMIKNIKVNVVSKLFGNLTYEKKISQSELNYQVYDFETSVFLTERGHLDESNK